MLKENWQKIERGSEKGFGMDVIIISTSSKQQEKFWQQRLNGLKGDLIPVETRIVVIEEDWPGGAGNGLGTLYAYHKAREKLLELQGVDILKLQQDGAAVAIYHTAGQGTRLSPLTASEYNNKPGVKLPGLVKTKDGIDCMTILEAVIKQTAPYASSRKKRLSVFWGDQIFIPSKTFDYKPSFHIDILAKLTPMPSEKEWIDKGLEKYGLITIDNQGNAQQIDKCDYQTIQKLISSYKVETQGGVGMSLGSFSLSLEMTLALMDEFSPELTTKSGKIDVEPGIWMATTLDKETYLSIMAKKQVSEKSSMAHYQRMQAFKNRFKNSQDRFFGAVDVGSDCYWWDYGTIDSYFHTNMKILQNTVEGQMMRRFYRIKPEQIQNGSCLINCKINHNNSKNSILCGVVSDDAATDSSLLIDCQADAFQTKNSLLYHVVEQGPVFLEEGDIRADLFLPASEQHLKIYTRFNRDGKEDWNKQLPQNPYSYAELYELCKIVNLQDAERYRHFLQQKITL